MPFRFSSLSYFLEIHKNQSSGTIFILGCSGPASSSTLSSTHLERKKIEIESDMHGQFTNCINVGHEQNGAYMK